MKIYGLQRLTLLDYPGHTACTVFLSGCNFSCPFCHNATLAKASVDSGAINESWFLEFLQKRRDILDGVTITGGEPTLNPDLKRFIKEIKALGYLVKLDTNGSNPSLIEDLIEDRAVDYIAMDIKSCPGKYSYACGKNYVARDRIGESIKRIIEGGAAGKIDYEFRTTVVDELHNVDDFVQIGRMINGAKRYYIQPFVDAPDVLCKGFHAPDRVKLSKCLEVVKGVDTVEIRGTLINPY